MIIAEKYSSPLADVSLTSGRSVLCCFSKRELANFFGNSEAVKAMKQNPAFVWIDAPLSAEHWRQVLLETQPEVLMGAWDMPMLSDELLAECPSVRYLCYLCGSVRCKVSRYFIESGGIVTNWGGLAADTVAECALMLTLSALRQMNRYALEMHLEKKWRESGPLPLTLYGKKVGVHGVGAVARKISALLEPFGCDVQFWSEAVPQSLYAEYGMRNAKGIRQIFSDNDVVIEAEALTPQTEGSINEEILMLMKPGSVLVNVGRGGVFAPRAIDALAKRGDVAIALDVYEVEPLPKTSILRGLKHVTLSPHMAGPTIDQYGSFREHALRNLLAYVNGGELRSVVTAEAYDRAT